ncbi:MAG: AMP-dependent synthetase/ligase [Halobacteriota archaeon]
MQPLEERDWFEAEVEYEGGVVGESTLPELFLDAAESHADEAAQRLKGGVYERSITPGVYPEADDGDWESVTYEEMREAVERLAKGFDELGVERGDRVGIFSDTRCEWALSDYALLSRGAVVTSVYKSSSARQAKYLLGDNDSMGVVCENDEVAERVFSVEDDLDLEFVVVIDQTKHDERDYVHSLYDVYEMGEDAFDRDEFDGWIQETSLDDLCTLIYTSGTTGQPKGVKCTHGNFRSSINQVYKRLGPRPDKDESLPTLEADTRVVSFLPLAHSYERFSQFLMFGLGAEVAYAESPDTLQEDFAAVRPTGGTSVPRVYEKMYEAIRKQASESPVKKKIFDWATEVGRQHYDAEDPGAWLNFKHALADRLVFSNVRDALGGRVEFFISGGGSLSPDLCRMYHGMGLPIIEGYGLTETAPIVTANPVEQPKIGTIGPRICEIEVKVDESEAAGIEPQEGGEVGELLVRGDNVTRGYWGKPEQTAEAFEGVTLEEIEEAEEGEYPADDAWFRTGDLVELRPDGYVEFRERVKQILVLSTGKNLAPAPIEDSFSTREFVEQCMVVADDQKFTSALIVPNFEAIREHAEDADVDLPENDGELCQDETVRSWIWGEIEEVNQNFEEYEKIKKFECVAEEWTEHNDMLTPSLKKKRRNILKEHADAVERIYAEEEDED